MATFNGEKYVKEQVASILAQLSSHDELIVSDDGSTDNTIQILNSFQDKRIIICKNEGTHGYTPNFENALKKASGDYIFLSDQDDVWINGKVDKCLRYLQEYDFVYSDCITTNAELIPFDYSHIDSMKIRRGFWHVMLRNRYLGCCMAFRKKVLTASLPFPKKYKLLEHDTWFASLANKYFTVFILKEPLIYYRRHGGNTSDGGIEKTKKNSVFNMFIRRLYRFVKVLFRRKKCKI